MKVEEASNVFRYLVGIFAIGVLFRWATACGPYSGQGKPPMFGDYEAQRHWMEITYALPIQQWYVNSSDNDLQYWGLDYPPLTAYHSWLLGAISSKLNQSWINLHTSRGYESYQHKLFMRYSVLLADVMVYMPAVSLYVLRVQKATADVKTKAYFLITWLLYPSMILIDYGHFQYNCVSLGLFLWAVAAVMTNHDLFASTFFVLALSYKQMELYHAFPFFCYLLGNCIRQRSLLQGCYKLIKLAVIVLGTILVTWFPFITDYTLLTQVIHRLFPFARGLFEDKVANVWCALSVIIKWRQYFQLHQLVFLCASTTILALIPMIVLTIIWPTRRNFKLSLIISALIFFLFSFQVHEKSILLVAIPMLLCLNDEPFVVSWFLLTSVISLFPLCVKDGLQLTFFAWMLVYYPWICDFLQLQPNVVKNASKDTSGSALLKRSVLHGTVWTGLSICLLSLIIKPPARYPDLFPLMNSVFCCFQFCCCLVYFYWLLLQSSVLSTGWSVQKLKEKAQ